MTARTSLQIEHSRGDLRCQSGERLDECVADVSPAHPIVSRFGAKVLRDGYTAIPNLLLKHYSRLGLSPAELVCVQQLCSFWWRSELPHPAVSTIATRMGKCVRQVQYYLSCLQRRGLLDIVPRQNANGVRLTNAYDLQPLFTALAAIDDTTGQEPEEGNEEEIAPVQSVAPPALQNLAPKEDVPRKKTQNDLDSIPAHEEQCTATSIGDAPHVSQELAALLATLGTRFSDSAPRSSLTRVLRRIEHAHVTPAIAKELLTEASIRTAQRTESIDRLREMPYLLATFESLLQSHGAAVSASTPVRLLEPVRHPPGPSTVHELEFPAETSPLWRAVLDELQHSLPRATMQQLLQFRVVQDGDCLLHVAAPTAFLGQWLERVLRKHLMRTLEDLGHGDVELEITVGPEYGSPGWQRSEEERTP